MEKIILPDADLEYYPGFYSKTESDALLSYFLNLEMWEQHEIKMFGKEVFQPRLTALFGTENRSYTYSGLRMSPYPFSSEIEKIASKCEKYCATSFNTCLANLYRDGNDSMGWHSDDEKELGKEPVIASLSLGAERILHFKHKRNFRLKYKLPLENGSLLIMKGTTQDCWKHQLPKIKRKVDPRVNLTFRKIH